MNAAGRTSSPAPQRRLILLGASNLARGIATVTSTAQAVWNEPLDLVAALGHGRSYGSTSWVLGRALPGIVRCQLWNDLAARPALPTAAIVTDVGNDILYGVSPEKISAWIKICCDRLLAHRATVTMTGVPLASIARLRPAEFKIFRTILFPFSRIDFASAMAAAQELDDRLRGVAHDAGARFIEPEGSWFGIDRIHIRRAAQATAWRQFFAPLAADWLADIPSATRREFFYIRSLTPYRRWICGIAHGRAQPSGRLAGGTLVSLY